MSKINVIPDKTFGVTLDIRVQGSGKTYSALKQTVDLAKGDEDVIFVAPSYDFCEELVNVVENNFGFDKVMTAHGRPYFCPYCTEELYKYIDPIYICKICESRDNCGYIAQNEELKNGKKGRLIFTVQHNLGVLTHLLPDAKIIMDDVDINSVIWRSYEITREEYEANKKFFKLTKDDYPLLYELFWERNYDVIGTKSFREELERWQRVALDVFKETGKLPFKTKLPSILYEAVMAGEHDYRGNKVFWNDVELEERIKKNLIRYNRASLTPAEEQWFKELEAEGKKIRRIRNEIENPNLKVYQCKDKLNPGMTLLDKDGRLTKTGLRYLEQAIEIVKKLEQVNKKALVVAPKRVIEKGRELGIIPNDVVTDYFYSPKSRGSNFYKDFDTIIIIGVLFKPLSSYNHPMYDGFEDKKEIARLEVGLEVKDYIGRIRPFTKRDRKLVLLLSNIKVPGLKVDELILSKNLPQKAQEGLSHVTKYKIIRQIYLYLKITRSPKVQEIAERLYEKFDGVFSITYFRNLVKQIIKIVESKSSDLCRGICFAIGTFSVEDLIREVGDPPP